MNRWTSRHVKSYADQKLTRALSVESTLSTACLVSGKDARLICTLFGDEADGDSLLALNAIRDARQRQGRYNENGRGIEEDSNKAASIATSALNRWRSGSADADKVISLALARASILCPVTSLSCLHDAALRLRSSTDDEKSLRRVLMTLGNCGRRRAPDSNLNAHEEWLCGRLTSKDISTVEAVNVASYASLLFSPLSEELEAPLSWEACLQSVLPRALNNGASFSACLHLADVCCAMLTTAEGPFSFECADTIRCLLENQLDARLSFGCRNRSFFKCAAVLERLVTNAAQMPGIDLWGKLVAARECSWVQALWLWFRGHGSDHDADIWIEGCDSLLQPTTGTALCVVQCEVVITICCASPLPLFRAEKHVGRLGVVRLFVDKIIKQIIGAPDPGVNLQLWITAIARQLPRMSPREYLRLRSGLFAHVFNDLDVCDGSEFAVHARVSSLLGQLSANHLFDPVESILDERAKIGFGAGAVESARATINTQ